jgi:SAM-dependent methyltransferase
VPAFARSALRRGLAVAFGGGGNTNRPPRTGKGERLESTTYIPRRLVRRVEFRQPTPLALVGYALASVVLVPAYAAAATVIGTPGMRFHREAIAIAARLVLAGGLKLATQAGRLALYPMDSTRYFEFDSTWSALMRLGPVDAYLDVSSPRFLPLCYARRRDVGRVVLLNPDAADMATTETWAAALGLSTKCRFGSQPIESLGPDEELFDVITSISVFEHVKDDREALLAVRRLLRPGGTLLLTLPCARVGYDQYRDFDEYGLTRPDAEGRYFFQRFYDASSLRDRVFAALGEPRRVTVYGERKPGFFGRSAEAKMRGLPYPFWREGYMMGRHFQIYPSVDALPGEGVVALEFVNQE